MISYDPHRPLISLHVPKTAGTSLRRVLETWFPHGRLLLHYRSEGIPPQRHQLSGGVCVHGHFNGARNIGAWQYYPEVRQFITFLRDPFDRFLSQWHYLNWQKSVGVKIPELDDKPGFDQWIVRRAAEQANGKNAFSFLWQMPVAPGELPASTLFSRYFVHVGIVEHAATSMVELATALDRPVTDLPHLNAAPNNQYTVFECWRQWYEEHFADEYEVYRAAQEFSRRECAGLLHGGDKGKRLSPPRW